MYVSAITFFSSYYTLMCELFEMVCLLRKAFWNKHICIKSGVTCLLSLDETNPKQPKLQILSFLLSEKYFSKNFFSVFSQRIVRVLFQHEF